MNRKSVYDTVNSPFKQCTDLAMSIEQKSNLRITMKTNGKDIFKLKTNNKFTLSTHHKAHMELKLVETMLCRI